MLFSVLYVVCLITATVFRVRDTVPFLRENKYDVEPHYNYWLIRIIWHFKMAMAIALGPNVMCAPGRPHFRYEKGS